MRAGIVVGLMMFILHCTGQQPYTPLAEAYSATCSSRAGFSNPFSITSDDASFAGAKKITLGVYGERSFLQPELPVYMIASVVPVAHESFGVLCNYSGQPVCNSGSLKIAYARSLGNLLDAGIGFSYGYLKIPGYGNAVSAGYSASMLLHFSSSADAVISVANPTGAISIKGDEDVKPGKFSLGLNYHVSDCIHISANLSKNQDHAPSVHAGLHYGFDNNRLFTQAGFSSAIPAWFIGAGYRMKKITVELLSSVHPQLGVTPALVVLLNNNDQ